MATFKVSQKRENKKGEAPIYISFYLNREKIEVPVRISVPLAFFDKENGIVKTGDIAVVTAGVVDYARRHEPAASTNIMRVVNID